MIGSTSSCCGSKPRCRTCPVVLAAELRAVSGLAAAGGRDTLLPVHLVGVPACLHKYEPLLRKVWSGREAPASPAD